MHIIYSIIYMALEKAITEYCLPLSFFKLRLTFPLNITLTPTSAWNTRTHHSKFLSTYYKN